VRLLVLVLCAAIALTGCGATHSVLLPATLSLAPTTCGPFADSYCATVKVDPAAAFKSADSFNCLGWSVKNDNTGYYSSLVYQPAATVTVKWKDGSTIYVGSPQAAVAGNVITFSCEGT